MKWVINLTGQSDCLLFSSSPILNLLALTPSVIFISGPCLLVQNHLSVTKKGHNLAGCLGFNHRIPYLGGPPNVKGTSNGHYNALLSSEYEIGLQLYSR